MNAMGRYLPVFHDVFGASVLVVGAGAVGTRKIEALLEGGARITVVAKEFPPAVEERAARGDLTILRGAFRPEQMEEAELVFAATPDRTLNHRVSAEARRRRIPVNVADSPEECTFLLPSVIRGEEFTAAISTEEGIRGRRKRFGSSSRITGRRFRSELRGGDAGSGSLRDRERSTSSAPGREIRTCLPSVRWGCCGAPTPSFTTTWFPRGSSR